MLKSIALLLFAFVATNAQEYKHVFPDENPWDNEKNYFPKGKNFAIRHKATGNYVDVDDYEGKVYVKPGKCNIFRFFPQNKLMTGKKLWDWSGNWGSLKIRDSKGQGLGLGEFYITTSARNPMFGSGWAGWVMPIWGKRKGIDQSWEFNMMTKDGCILGWEGRVDGDPWETTRPVAWKVGQNDLIKFFPHYTFAVNTVKYEQGDKCDAFEVVETGCP